MIEEIPSSLTISQYFILKIESFYEEYLKFHSKINPAADIDTFFPLLFVLAEAASKISILTKHPIDKIKQEILIGISELIDRAYIDLSKK